MVTGKVISQYFEFIKLQHHLYCAPAAHVANVQPGHKNFFWFFISEYLRRELLDRNEDCLKILDPSSKCYL
jgi:hypothetical protein